MNIKIADRAVPRITLPLTTPAERIFAAYTHITALRNSPEWAAAAEVQSAATAWSTETDNLDASTVSIADLESKLATARTSHLAVLRRWEVRKRATLNAVNAYCDGSKDRVQQFGLSVLTRAAPSAATVPEGLRGKRSKMIGTATVVWTTRRGNHGFMVQYATDPTIAATFSAPVVSLKGKFELTGQTPGATISFRVLALDPSVPTRQTEYTPWVAVRVSS